MSVVLVKEIWTDRSGVFSGTDDTDVRNFHVVCNNLNDNAKTVENSGLVPSRFSAHPTRPSIFADEIATKQHAKSGFWWRTSVTYRRITAGMPSLPVKEFQPDPLLRAAIITGHSVNAHGALTRARPLIDPAVSSSRPKYETISEMVAAGGPYDRTFGVEERFVQSSARELAVGLQEDTMEFVWKVQLNVYPLPDWLLSYSNSVNNAPVQIRNLVYPRRTLKFKGLSLSDLQEETNNVVGTILFFTVTFNLHYNPRSWVRAVADKGIYRLNDDGDQVQILTPQGAHVSEPVFLDGAGAVLTPILPENEKAGWWLSSLEKDFSIFPLNPT